MLTLSFIIAAQTFSPQGEIPSKYTCDGRDISPQISWSNIPENTKSLALIVDDPDARDPEDPKMINYVHWVLYNIPTQSMSLPENVMTNKLPPGTLEGLNDWGKTGYGGPCPPSGTHHYYFKLYALNTILPDLKHPTKTQLEQNMENHIIEMTELVGTYKLQKKN